MKTLNLISRLKNLNKIPHFCAADLQKFQKSDNTKCWWELFILLMTKELQAFENEHYLSEKNILWLYNLLILLLDSHTKKHLNMEILRKV